LICGPVFPHEVVGFSGGNKYFFPGISGAELIDLSHWLGALITSYEIIGTKHTPVRKLIDLAATMIPVPRSAICCVVTQQGLAGVFSGSPEEAWRQAADLSAQVHIRWMDHPYQTVLSILPPMYPELWTGAKGMYKLEPVVTDGGELILYAPHIKVISVTHEKWIREIGYHVRDYYLTQMERFAQVPKGVIAHTTFLRGVGSYDPATGIERPRIKVTLATGIPEADCRALNLGYLDPASIDVEAWLARTDPNLLVVQKAGEYLYRLKVHENNGK
jgi:nickel-dependent lactate racemase